MSGAGQTRLASQGWTFLDGGSAMNNKEQIAFVVLRESQHRAHAERAMRIDTAAFHEEMAMTFQRLAEEAKANMELSSDSSDSASPYLNW